MGHIKRLIIGLYITYKNLDFQSKLYSIVSLAGIPICTALIIAAIVMNNSVLHIWLLVFLCIYLLILLICIIKGKTNKIIYIITILIIFFICIPILFFAGGGYTRSTPCYLILAIMLTVLILRDNKAIYFALCELAFYIGLYIIAYYFPDTVTTPLSNAFNLAVENIGALLTVGTFIAVTMHSFFRLYDRQKLELETSREEALRLSEVKNIFLSNMSHEIRTPINVMINLTEMIYRESRDETISSYSQRILSSGQMLLSMVNNILDVSKIEAGKIVLSADNYRTSQLIHDLYEIGTEYANKYGLIFNIHVNDMLPSELKGDITRIKQIVLNLLSNAFKYTNKGTITLSFTYKYSMDDDEKENRINFKISVKDTGIGIEDKDLSIIFGNFNRLEFATRQHIDGTGLGLPIVKELTELMNGRVNVVSQYGSGSEFWVDIPQMVLDKNPIGNWINDNDNHDRTFEESFIAPDAIILIVDDNLDNLFSMKAVLKHTLIRVDTVRNGEQCINALKNVNYHLIMMDYMMPNMDGIETFRQICKNIPDFNTPVIALTANAISGTESKLLEEGFAAYITKPVQAHKLEEIIMEYLSYSQISVVKIKAHSHLNINSELKTSFIKILSTCNISLEEGLRCTNGDIYLYVYLAEAFTRGYNQLYTNMLNVGRGINCDLDLLRNISHTLKSSAGYVGASDLSILAEMLEKYCVKNDQQSINVCLPHLLFLWEKVNITLFDFIISFKNSTLLI